MKINVTDNSILSDFVFVRKQKSNQCTCAVEVRMPQNSCNLDNRDGLKVCENCSSLVSREDQDTFDKFYGFGAYAEPENDYDTDFGDR